MLGRHRHLLNDLASMLPHGRKDAKFDSKSKLYELNELGESVWKFLQLYTSLVLIG